MKLMKHDIFRHNVFRSSAARPRSRYKSKIHVRRLICHAVGVLTALLIDYRLLNAHLSETEIAVRSANSHCIICYRVLIDPTILSPLG